MSKFLIIQHNVSGQTFSYVIESSSNKIEDTFEQDKIYKFLIIKSKYFKITKVGSASWLNMDPLDKAHSIYIIPEYTRPLHTIGYKLWYTP